jgi:threonine/homoserine/homoserine lactone efflux protein
VIQLIEIILFALTSFAVGLSGSLVPGPMLTITITDSLKKGFKAGPLIVLGHIMAELTLVILIIGGLSWLIGSNPATMFIGIFGGLTLMVIGYQTARSTEEISEISILSEGDNQSSGDDKQSTSYGSVFRGFIASVSNPYFFIWWATIGCAFIFKGLELAGIFGVLAFFIGHWASDLGWYSLVSFFTNKGSGVMTNRHYKIIMTVCGVFLIFLGIYFVLSSQKII